MLKLFATKLQRLQPMRNASTLVLPLIFLPCPLSCPLSCAPAPQPMRGDGRRETESGRDADANRRRCVYDFIEKTE